MLDEFDVRSAIKEMRRQDRLAAAAFLQACERSDVALFYRSVDALNLSSGGWRLACKRAARLRKLSRGIQMAFLEVWIETKMLPLSIGDNRIACAAARVLLPPYRGPAVRLFRGTSWRERCRRIYGMSWSAEQGVAERFAEHWQPDEGGAVVIETLAPSAAILCAPHLAGGHYEEQEYIVDRRHLGDVQVTRRYPQISQEAARRSLLG